MNSVVTDALINEAQQANKRFDEIVGDGGNAQKQLVHCVRQVFQRAYLLTSSVGYMDVKEQLVAAQVMTDVVMKKLSPVAFETETYAKFANGYVLNNPKEFSDVTEMDGTEYAFTEAKKAYDGMDREGIKVNEVNVENGAVVPPVENVPKVNAPVIDKK